MEMDTQEALVIERLLWGIEPSYNESIVKVYGFAQIYDERYEYEQLFHGGTGYVNETEVEFPIYAATVNGWAVEQNQAELYDDPSANPEACRIRATIVVSPKAIRAIIRRATDVGPNQIISYEPYGDYPLMEVIFDTLEHVVEEMMVP